MGIYELNELNRQPSNFDQEVLEAARDWADETRPGLKDINGIITDHSLRDDDVSPMDKLEQRLSEFGISSAQSIEELVFIGMDLSKKIERDEK